MYFERFVFFTIHRTFIFKEKKQKLNLPLNEYHQDFWRLQFGPHFHEHPVLKDLK